MKVDYQKFCPKDTPKEDRRKKNIGDIYSNALKCLLCNQIIRSTNKHDYVTCKCGECSVDGGSWYCKYSGNPKNMESLSEMYSDV